MAEAVLGFDKAKALASHPTLTRQKHLPQAKRWLCEMRARQGHSTAEIARKVRASDTVVRRWVKETRE